ncbi:MAG: hypothetical protein KJZ58_01695 [Flavobacteriales bacterium]|nr:hypothetical protein [Flavobacteriales bacterium]
MFGPHTLYIDDPGFLPGMAQLKPRSIRVSTGRYDDPGTAADYSTDTAVLRNLPSEFYRGPNTLAGADDPANYDFSYVDSLVDVVHAMGAEPFLDMAAMPITLSSVDTPAYVPYVYDNPPCHLFSWDNGIRTAPPADPAVYGRVFYHLVKHLYDTRGVRWFEVWNEPDQFPGFTPFWDGDVPQLHAMLAALSAEVNADPGLSPNVEIGCCSFAMQSFLNLFMVQFLATVQQNNTRLDFLSVHPYSSDAMGGYDSATTTTAEFLRDLYVPGTPLVNAEWGILSPFFGSAGWSSLDYGLDRIRALIEMQDRDHLFAHVASLADNDTTVSTCCLGMYYTKPTFAPKPAAFAYIAMNRFNNTLQRLSATANAPHLVLSGRSNNGDTIHIALPAPDPDPGTGQVVMNVAGLPWTTGSATRYELTMDGYADNTVLSPASGATITDGTFADTLTYASDQGNGRLFLWELVRDPEQGIADPADGRLRLVPDATRDAVSIALPNGERPDRIRVLGMDGKLLRTASLTDQIELQGLPAGMYLIAAELRDGQRLCARWARW